MSDSDFVRAFESCELSTEDFRHRDHVRLAWIYLRRYGASEASLRMAEGIRRFAVHHNTASKYHETVTQAWMRLLAPTAGRASFDQVAADFPQVLSKDFLREFYSDAVLQSEAARLGFVEPDKKPLLW